MANSTWLMFRTLRESANESRNAAMLLMELSRLSSDARMAARICDTAQRLMDDSEAVRRLSGQLQSGTLCHRQCPGRMPGIRDPHSFAADSALRSTLREQV
ncbi:hypothetical protein [Pseudomonas sp. SO81]|uniref:hypothetical protein n=1 Tax=Pseudomonas sp. SO81 TaxID=2983246 RepID=UPI0025A3F124|nr:hypothetical protein [Pseudomonas sp. SO81]WJN61680.1 hypothetical protein OH686_23320 [Pseudomonas sp. SO81]